jgi:hypothetical protein
MADKPGARAAEALETPKATKPTDATIFFINTLIVVDPKP